MTASVSMYRKAICGVKDKPFVVAVVFVDADGRHVGGRREEFHTEEQAVSRLAALETEIG